MDLTKKRKEIWLGSRQSGKTHYIIHVLLRISNSVLIVQNSRMKRYILGKIGGNFKGKIVTVYEALRLSYDKLETILVDEYFFFEENDKHLLGQFLQRWNNNVFIYSTVDFSVDEKLFLLVRKLRENNIDAKPLLQGIFSNKDLEQIDNLLFYPEFSIHNFNEVTGFIPSIETERYLSTEQFKVQILNEFLNNKLEPEKKWDTYENNQKKDGQLSQ